MEKITTSAELKIAIQNLKFEQEVQGQLLKQNFYEAFDSLKPANLIKNTLHDVTSSPYLIDNILSTTMGLVTGYVSKKIAIGGSSNMVRKIVGSLLQFGVTNVVAQHSGTIKKVGNFFINMIHKNDGKTEKN